MGDVRELAARTGAKVLGPAGLIVTMIDLGWVGPDRGVRFGKGGKVRYLGGVLSPRLDDGDSAAPDSTLPTELHAWGIFVLPPGTLHAGAS